MANMFEVGDKVKRTYFSGSDDMKMGEVYEVESTLNFSIEVKGVKGDWAAHYFELVEEKNMFSKKDLKTGMRVEHRNGQVGIVLLDLGHIGYSDGFNSLSIYNNDLECHDAGEEWDIVKVYDKPGPGNILKLDVSGKLLWEEPAKKTRQQKQIRELEETIKKATQQIEELKANS